MKEQSIGFWGAFCIIGTLVFAVWGFISFVVTVGGHILHEDGITISATSTMVSNINPCSKAVGIQENTVIASTTDHPYVLLSDYEGNGGCYKIPLEHLQKSDFISVI